jgi:hypothetical protein
MLQPLPFGRVVQRECEQPADGGQPRQALPFDKPILPAGQAQNAEKVPIPSQGQINPLPIPLPGEALLLGPEIQRRLVGKDLRLLPVKDFLGAGLADIRGPNGRAARGLPELHCQAGTRS